MIDEIDLSSFKLKDGLSGRIWKNKGVIKSDVRLNLIEIAEDFWESLGIDWVEVEDIVLTGSICNYNWSYDSDIDLHLMVDYSKVGENTDLVEKYFKGKKQEWCDSHDIKINGFDVEVYVQDTNGENESGGVYSLNTMEWIRKPKKGEFKEIDQEDEVINGICDEITDYANELSRVIYGENVGTRVEDAMECVERLIDKLVDTRRSSLSKGGEMSKGNIVYKALRRNGVIDMLYELSNDAYDKIHSM